MENKDFFENIAKTLEYDMIVDDINKFTEKLDEIHNSVRNISISGKYMAFQLYTNFLKRKLNDEELALCNDIMQNITSLTITLPKIEILEGEER